MFEVEERLVQQSTVPGERLSRTQPVPVAPPPFARTSIRPDEIADISPEHRAFVQHLGDEQDEAWVAFGAFDPDDPTCAVLIDREAKVLVNECDESVTYPLSGEGLRQYPTTVENGRIIIDVNELTTSTTAG